MTITREDLKTISKGDLASFCYIQSGQAWQPKRHLLYIADAVQNAIETPDSRLIINIAPRHGKSQLVGIYAPVWFLKNYPDKEVIYCTYGADLSYKKSRLARDLFRRVNYGLPLSEESSSVSTWNVGGKQIRGNFQATGIGGSITGTGADLMILDDLFKNHIEAESAAQRDKVWEFWESTLLTRLMPGASVILIMTRWHEDDIAGRLRKTGDWDEIVLPAIAEENDLLGREEGEALCPDWYPIEKLRDLKRQMSHYVFSALYQQSPTVAEGQRFKSEWFHYYEKDKENNYWIEGRRVSESSLHIYQTIDTAGTANITSDYFVVLTYGITPDRRFIILDIYREQIETTRHLPVLRQQRDKWKPTFQAVENQTFGMNIIQQAKEEGLPIKPLKADKSKWFRSEQAVIMYQNGLIYHPRNVEWLGDLEQELLEFPKGKHDDIVDCISYAAILAEEDRGGVDQLLNEWK